MKTRVGKRSPCAAQLARHSFGDVEKVSLGQQVLLTVHLQLAFAFQDDASYVYLGVDVQRHTFAPVKTEKFAIKIGAL